MIPDLILDMRDDSFRTQAELTALINEKLADACREFGGCMLRQIIITPHQEKLLKLELAENFVFRWKNLKQKYLDNIGGAQVVLAEEDEPLGCSDCGGVHEMMDH